MTLVSAPTLSAESTTEPFSGAPGILLTVTNTQLFNLFTPNDASFETGIGSAVPSGCAVAAPSDLDSSGAPIALDGTHSLRMTCTAAGATADLMTATLGPYDVLPSTKYTLRVPYLFDQAASGDSNQWEVTATIYDDTHTVLATHTDGPNAFLRETAVIWQTEVAAGFVRTIFFTTPATAATIDFTFSVIDPSGPLAPPAVSVAVVGTTGSETWAYIVAPSNATGYGVGSAAAIVTDGIPIVDMDGSDYNALTWASVSGATDYWIYRASVAAATCAEIATDYTNCADLAAAFATCADLAAAQIVSEYELIAVQGSVDFNDLGGAPTSPVPGWPMTPTEVDSSGQHVYADELGFFKGDYTGPWFLPTPGAFAIKRNDGNYVLGASPLFPLIIGPDGETASIIDGTAPYGIESTYVAALTIIGVGSSLPSMPASALMGQAPDTEELYHRLGWAQEEDVTGLLRQWVSGIGEMLQFFDSISRDSYDLEGNVAPSWSPVLDINRCPTIALPWLGQFVGARVPTTLRDDQMRYLIENVPGWKRGTPAAILAAADQYLLAGFSATLTERDTSPYHLTIDVPTAGVSGDATCRSIALGFATCADLAAAFATCADVWASTAEIENAVLAAIPAGLVAAISFA